MDPASGQLSCSRVGMFILVAVLFPASLVLQVMGFNLGQAWSSFVALAGTLAGIYGLNSAARVFNSFPRLLPKAAAMPSISFFYIAILPIQI